MDVEEDYDSDSTVIISDFYKNPEKIARKRRKLDAKIRKMSDANIQDANDAENTAPNIPNVNLPIHRKEDRNSDTETKLRNRFLSGNDHLNINNDSMVEDLKIKKELLKLENNSEEREGSDDKVVEEDIVTISDDSDDDCTIVTDDTNMQVDKNTNLIPGIGVLAPSAINARRATLDSLVRNESASNISDCVKSANPNKVNPKLIVLKPSAINSRRATITSFEKNEATLDNLVRNETASNISDCVKSPNPNKVNAKLVVLKPSAINSRRATFEGNNATSENVVKHVNLSSGEGGNKEDRDNNKAKKTANKQANETNRLSGYKNYGDHPPKLITPNQNEISRKRNSDGVLQAKHKNLQAENITSPKSNDMNNEKIAAVIKVAKENKSINSSSVIVRTADFRDKNIREMSENKKKLDAGVNINDPNRTNPDHHKTGQMNTVDNACKNVTVTKINDSNRINSNVNESEDARNRSNDQTTNLGNISVDIGVFDGSKKENQDSSNRSPAAKRVAVDGHTLNTNVSCDTVARNTNTVENPIVQELKNILKQIVVQGEDIGVLDDSTKADEQLSNISTSANVSRNVAEIQTPNKKDRCSSTVSHSNSIEHPVMDVSEKNIKDNKFYQTDTGECSKSDDKVNKLNYEPGKRVDHDQDNNSNQNAEIDNSENATCCDKAHEHVTEFQISFFRNVRKYLKTIFQNSKLVSKLRASTRTLEREVKHIIRNAKKHGAPEIRYACPKCSQISVYSPEAMYQIGDDNNPILEHNILKCKSCRGLQILYNTQQIYLQYISDKNSDDINTAVRRQESTSELLSTENNDVAINRKHNPDISIAGPSTSNMSVTSNKNEVSNIVVDSLATINHAETAISVNNGISTKTGQNQTPSNETSVSNENDEITSGNGKTKSYKRTVDNNVSPINFKRAKTDTNTRDESTKFVEDNCNYQAELNSTTDNPSSLLNEPTKSNNSDNKLGNSDITYNKGGLLRNYDETVSRQENKAKLTQTLIGCFTKFQTKENYEDTKAANVHTCPECTCLFGSHTTLIEHMSDNHNISENLSKITCPLCNVHLNETNYMAHVKVHFPDENTKIVSNKITDIDKNLNTTDADIQQQKKARVAKASESKQYECKICKKVLYSLFATKKHRKGVHGHLDLKNKKLFIVTEKKGVGLDACLENAVTESKNSTAGNQEEIANVVTGSLGGFEMNKREESRNNEVNDGAVIAQNFIEKGNDKEQNFNNSKEETNVAQKCNENIDGQKKDNQERKRKASNEDMNIILEAKQANLGKSRGENEITEHENKDDSSLQDTTKSDAVTKLHETDKDAYSVNQPHNAKSDVNLSVNVEMISDSNTQEDISVAATSSNLTEVDETGKVGEINDMHMDNTEDSHKKCISEDSYPLNTGVDESNKLPGGDSSQNVDDGSYTKVEDEKGGEQKKVKFIFPTKSKGKPILANCYNCRTNIDVNDMNDHDCRQKIASILYNCFMCGVSVPHDDAHQCETEDKYCIENIQITKVVTVKEAFVFKCEDCNSTTDIYDDVIRHCQNHYNGIKDPIAFCETCQLFYNTACFETHKHLHEKDVKVINYSYKSLFWNWDRIFQDMPSDVVEEMRARSIYTSHCVKMRISSEGPWQYTLYQCNQCETCVPPGKVDQHCRRQCYSIAHPCSVCQKLFISHPLLNRHELHHKTTEQFKVIEFNCKKDERFNLKLFDARKFEIESRMPVADLFKCLCSVYFTSNDSFKKHFVGCNLENKGVLCPRCDTPRLFEANELEGHLHLHHSGVAYRFRVNTIVVQQEMEPVNVDRDVGRVDDDLKGECFEEENCERRVA